ncbi:fatty acyl-CoA reductase 1-like [Battus philenor]|uniref:fatty acyl-CoA reductase 1-like n=1 Tax=Battus philenor TaxID=42288 RepID=UPI0035CEBE61
MYCVDVTCQYFSPCIISRYKMASDKVEMESELPDRIAETFSDQTVFITGGTGFMGKVLVEKLLRKCPDIREIVLLVRKKKGICPKERLQQIFSGPLFAKVSALRGGVDQLLSKVRVIDGDVSEADLAMSNDSRQYIIDNVDIVVHAAATIRFDEALKKAILLNVRGTKLILNLAKECKKLKLFVHISTAYCHLHEKLLEEKPYDPPADPHKILAAAELFDHDTFESITPKLLNDLPNSYAFTKALSEALAVEAMGQIPVIILRPSIVIPIWREPLPGWTDNLNGPTGLLIGAGKGVIRSMYCRSNSYADYLPVDVFINGIMMAAWNYIKRGDKETTIYNFTSSAEVKITWTELIETGREIILNRVPLNGVVWYPGGSMKHSRLSHNICAILFHWIPAVLVDTLLIILRYEPVLLRVHRRISKGFDVFEYYTNNQWDFKSDAGQRVRKNLNAREKEDYKFDAVGVNISNYFEDCIRAARVYMLKETDDTIPAAKRHMKIMRTVDIIVRFLFIGFIMWTLWRWTSMIFSTKTEHLQIM